MRAAIFAEPGRIEVGDGPDAVVVEPTNAVVRVVLACVCGSDLWYYRGDSPLLSRPIGHEFIGVVEQTGAAVDTLAEGALVIAPFAFSDGTCPHCRAGFHNSCINGGFFGGDATGGGQGERVRVPFADGTPVKVPAGDYDDDATMRSFLALSDVMATGHHAAVSANLKPGDTIGVVGDGAVGLSAVLAANRSAPAASSPCPATRPVKPWPASSEPPTSSPNAAGRRSRPCSTSPTESVSMPPPNAPAPTSRSPPQSGSPAPGRWSDT